MSHGPTDEQVLDVLAQHDLTTATMVAEATGEEWEHVDRALHRLARHGQIVRVRDAHGFRGWRAAPEEAPDA